MTNVSIIGLGNIGSAAVPLVARLPGVSQITLVDPDVYDESNVTTQSIGHSAVGKPKAEVQAAQVSEIAPSVRAVAIQERVENVPMGLVRGSMLLACVDNRRARQCINRVARRIGSSWIDAAVGHPSLVRVGAYASGAAAACLECAWDQSAYDLLEQEYPCAAGEPAVPATNVAAELGALAAALQVTELRKRLSDPEHECTHVMLDATTHARHLSRYTRNEHCRFDHMFWSAIENVALDPDVNTLADLFAATDASDQAVIGVDGHRFATHFDCIEDGRRRSVGLVLADRLVDDERTCDCGGRMYATGFFSFETIRRSELSPAQLSLRLSSVGLRAHDVISLTDATGSVRHLEILAGE